MNPISEIKLISEGKEIVDVIYKITESIINGLYSIQISLKDYLAKKDDFIKASGVRYEMIIDRIDDLHPGHPGTIATYYLKQKR